MKRGSLAAAMGALVVGATALAVTHQASAHGSMQNPVSRVYECFLENPEHPQSDACKAAVATGGTQPLYDWNEIHILDANGRSRDIIPDGKLCSAGTDKYKAFDQSRADWPATTMPKVGPFTFQYKATAPHRGSFEFFVTKDGYDPTKPLTWSDLEPSFAKFTDPPLANGVYTMQAQLPFAGKSGRHLIYTIWQRSDSPEAFYTCSDVVFGPGGPTTNPSTPAPGTCTAPEWAKTNQYPGNSLVSHNGHTWKAQWWTQGDEPGTANVWIDQGTCTPVSRTPGSCAAPVWDPTSIYTGGSNVSYQAHTWRAQWWTQGDTPGTAAVWVDLGAC
jgi:predicted carbohydrate-binding protein with CBM5 and CBM33 domain